MVLLGNQSGEMQRTAIQLAERIIDAVSQPMTIAGEPLKVTTSSGIALAPADSRNDTCLLEYADLALYHAKQEGRNNTNCFLCGWQTQRLGRCRVRASAQGLMPPGYANQR